MNYKTSFERGLITNVVAISVDYANECCSQHEYNKSFDFLDLASGIFQIAKGAVDGIAHVAGKAGTGVTLGFKDACDFLCYSEDLWDSIVNFVSCVRTQGTAESVGNVVQGLSRELTRMATVAGIVVGISVAVETGVAVASSIASVLAAKELLEPIATKIQYDGSAALDRTLSFGTSVCQVTLTAVAPVIEKLYGFSDAVNNLCFAMQGNGRSGDDGLTNFSSQEKLTKHFIKHKKEFGAITEAEYLERARNLVNSKAGDDILVKVRSNGDKLFFNKITGEFAVKSSMGFIKTLFKPVNGLEYFLKQ